MGVTRWKRVNAYQIKNVTGDHCARRPTPRGGAAAMHPSNTSIYPVGISDLRLSPLSCAAECHSASVPYEIADSLEHALPVPHSSRPAMRSPPILHTSRDA